MFDYYFTFRSMTAAQQAVMLLNKNGLFASFLRAPRALSAKGCGFAVRVLFQNGTDAAMMLRKAGAIYEKVFQMNASGAWMEAYL